MLVTGALMLGLGIGMLFDDAGAGVLIGLGVGFVAEAINKHWLQRRDKVED